MLAIVINRCQVMWASLPLMVNRETAPETSGEGHLAGAASAMGWSSPPEHGYRVVIPSPV